MNMTTWMRRTAVLSVVMAGLLTTGCAQSTTTNPAGAPAPQSSAVADDHSQWWCSTHGVPEEICAQCNSKLAAEYQQKGDWCQEHNRPESQCFLCNPRLADKFAAEYEAKYGKKPPRWPGT